MSPFCSVFAHCSLLLSLPLLHIFLNGLKCIFSFALPKKTEEEKQKNQKLININIKRKAKKKLNKINKKRKQF